MNAEWFFSDGDARQGPVTEDELKRLLAGGRVAPTDLVWKDGMPDWVEARTMTGFVPAGDDDRPRPARRSEGREGDRHWDDDDRPRYRRRADEDEGYDRPTRSRRRYEDDEDEDRPRHRRRSSEEVDYDI